MLHIKLLVSKSNIYNILSRTYLTASFKNVMNTNLNEVYTSNAGKSSTNIFSDPNALQLDSFVRSLRYNEERLIDLQDMLLKFRSGKEATNMLESTNYEVIKYLLNVGNVHEMLFILKNKRHFGIFLDEVTGCYILDNLLNNSKYTDAAQIAVELVSQEAVGNKLVNLLSIKSCYEYLKIYASSPIIEEEIADVKNSKDVQEKKVRVKFLQCYSPHEFNRNPVFSMDDITQAILKLSKNASKDIEINMKMIISLLSNNLEEMNMILKSNKSLLYKDVLNICATLANRDAKLQNISEILKETIDANTQEQSFEETINMLIKETSPSVELELIEKLKAKHSMWTEICKNILNEEEKQRKQINCITNSKETLDNITNRKQELWFFDLEEKLDLDIYNKRPIYPKRWFGKKKKPRVIDDNYIPPDIVKKSNKRN